MVIRLDRVHFSGARSRGACCALVETAWTHAVGVGRVRHDGAAGDRQPAAPGAPWHPRIPGTLRGRLGLHAARWVRRPCGCPARLGMCGGPRCGEAPYLPAAFALALCANILLSLWGGLEPSGAPGAGFFLSGGDVGLTVALTLRSFVFCTCHGPRPCAQRLPAVETVAALPPGPDDTTVDGAEEVRPTA